MKKITITMTLLVAFAAMLAGACFVYIGDLYSYGSRHVLTLKNFDEDSGLRAGPANFVGVVFWRVRTDLVEGDPVATIPYTFPYSGDFTFCWEVAAEATAEYMTLIDADGVEIMRIDAGGDCVTQSIGEERYEMRFFRDDISVEVPIFIRPDPDITNYWFDPGDAPTPTSFVISTNACPGCNMAVGDYFNARFNGTNFVGADLYESYLYQARLVGADLTDADCRGAIFEFADLTDAVLDGADFTYATWTNSAVCNAGSIGFCN